MNILQILPELNVGGVETGTVDLAKYLVRQGHRCVVVSAGGELVAEIEKHGVKHYELPVESKAFWVMFRAARQLQKIIRDEKIDIVHGRSRVPAWVGFMAARPTDAVFVTTAHGHYSRHIFSHVMGWGKYTIVPSIVIGRHMMDDFGVPRPNIRLIPRSVDLERYHFCDRTQKKRDGFLIGVVGRITPIKGQLYFLKALACVLRSMTGVKAWIIGGVSPGKDHYMEELEVWTRRLGLSETVQFLGNRRDIPGLLSQMDCLVMPSIAEESFGRVIVEAQAVGTPVVATKVGGVAEIIEDGVDGLLVHPKDHEVLAEAILKVLGDRALAQTLSFNGRKKVETKYTLERMAQDTLKVYEEALGQPRILVIKLGAVGDAILTIPTFKALKKKFPLSVIVCLTSPDTQDVYWRCPYIDELIVSDVKGRDRGPRALWNLAKKLMRRRFDLVVDLQNNKKSHLLAYATFAAKRYGYDNGKWSFFLNRAIKDSGEILGPVAHQFRVLKQLGIDEEDASMDLWPSAPDKAFADAICGPIRSAGQKIVGINIGASPRWQTKRWPEKSFAQLCDALAQQGFAVLLTGAPADAAAAQKILSKAKTKPLCLVAKTDLMQLAAVIEKCSVYVTADSAPLHIAAAMKTPFVALFGPTDARRHLPPADAYRVLQKGCPPCYKDTCRQDRHQCMEAITVPDVVAAIEVLLKNPA
jgi:predicted lipopolysaccharide heptosyltransferase III